MERLHYHPLSPFSRKAFVAALMRDEACEFVQVPIGTGALTRPEFLALSPFGKMPVLETNLPGVGNVIESTSIIEFWEERGPRMLLPPGRERIARYFDRIGDLYIVAPVAALWWEPTSEAGQSAEATGRIAWRLLGDALADGRPFLAGDAFSLADLAAAIGTDYFARLDVAPPDDIGSWCDRCFAVAAMRQALGDAMPYITRLHPRMRTEAGS
jgi:glutathione S-transferase